LIDGKLVIALGIVLLAVPFILSVGVAWVLSLTDSETVEETTETEGTGTKTTRKVTKTTPRHYKKGDWPRAAKFVLLALIISLVIIAMVYISQRDELDQSLPRINMLEKDEEAATLNGVLLSHDAEHWHVLVDEAGSGPEASEGDIKIVTLEEANNIRITK
jgi:hypothetical protein